MKNKRTCDGKRRYRDQQEATRVIHFLASHSTREKAATRAYECEDCCGWHITSMQTWRAKA